MATPLTAKAMLKALTEEGVNVIEVGSWRTHNRGTRGTGWGPVNGVMIHHTVTSGTDASVRICRDGYAGLPGPLCHAVADKQGRMHLVGHGRANHAGDGDPDVLAAVIREDETLPAPRVATQDGNSRFYGLEAVNLGDGKDPWPAAQLEAIARWAAAICRAHGWNQYSVLAHAEWQRGKIDPRGPGKNASAMMRDLRARVGALLAAPAGGEKPKPPPKPTPPATGGGAHTVARGETLWSIAQRYGVTVAQLRSANRLSGDVIHPGQRLTIPVTTYTVRRGDTLWGIASKHRTTVAKLKAANKLSSDTIHPGRTLQIPR
ncbi:peptidoglycan recognition protein family protein [Streptomyces bohaiensis]|uniref:LysM peptidoglycan-binding domain-containing protein n=1 Tax=Streptomyces bohaiensis TaxID=1431344 RepID=A0ABX1CA42_9ACTN|nr:LysM peptidoglycan-binding domain-containing protein [Streptomyces bohaiensis]NJQ14232.1 LysM peptidoglycan-binding domain-containing protein [Streptomyces bohaiensis]